MQWTKPDYEEVCLGMEVTAYVNTEDKVQAKEPPRRSEDTEQPRETPS